MKCPICKKPVPEPGQVPAGQKSYFPFCSDRCRLVDLNRWLDGRYQIPVREGDEDTPIPPPPAPADDE